LGRKNERGQAGGESLKMNIPKNVIQKVAPQARIRRKEQGRVFFAEGDQGDAPGVHFPDDGCDFRLQKIDPEMGWKGRLKSFYEGFVIRDDISIGIKWR
jgi:hypothetical protein